MEELFNNSFNNIFAILVVIIIVFNVIFVLFIMLRAKPVKYNFGMVYEDNGLYVGSAKKISPNYYKIYDKSENIISILEYIPTSTYKEKISNTNFINYNSQFNVLNLKGEKIGFFKIQSEFCWEIYDLNKNKVARIDW